MLVRPDMARLSELAGCPRETMERAALWLRGIEVDPTGKWRVHLISWDKPTSQEVDGLLRVLCRMCTAQVEPVWENVQELWRRVVELVQGQNPVLGDVLSKCDAEFDLGTVHLKPKAGVPTEFLDQHDLLECVESCLKRVMGGQWKVHVQENCGAPACRVQDLKVGMQATLRGMVLFPTEVPFRNGKRAVRFGLTDGSDTVFVKVLPGSAAEKVDLQEGGWVEVSGTIVEDKYEGEAVCVAERVRNVEAHFRKDTCQKKRVELHLHTVMSAMDSVVAIPKLFNLLSAWQHRCVAITDHGVVQAFPGAFEEAERTGIKLIFGVEGYLVDDNWRDQKPHHVILLARDKEGLRQLYRLVSESHLRFFHRVPRIPRALLQDNRSHLLVGSACQAGELYQAILQGKGLVQLKEIAGFYDYLEIQPVANNSFLVGEGKVRDEDELRQINRTIVELAMALGVPVVATCDVHFLEPQEGVYREVLMASRGNDHAEQPAPLYLRTTQEMLEEFSYLGEALARQVVIDGPAAVAEMVQAVEPVPRGLHAPKIENADQMIAQLAREEGEKLYGSPLPEPVRQRLEKELDAIQKHGFSVIYLIAQKLVHKSVEEGYLVGSRGSVGSSLVARLTGITEVNPLPPHYLCPQCKYSEFPNSSHGSGFDLPPKQCPRCGAQMLGDGHDIPFEVFMGFKGDKVPDIDLNFSGLIQSTIHRYAEELLGRGNVFRAGTIATVADKTAYGLVRAYAESKGLVLRKAEVERLARGITGVKRTTGQHPGGVMIVPAGCDVLEFTPVQYPADDRESGVVTTHFDYESISSRLVKLDILGHDDPTALKLLHEYTGIDPLTVPFNDPMTLKLFSSPEPLNLNGSYSVEVGTLGIPEFGTKFVRQMLVETRPQCFADLVRISGLSHGTDVWLGNARDLIKQGIARLGEVICTRDDIMTFLISKGLEPSQAFAIMENVRKGKGLLPEHEAAMREAGVPGWYIESCKKIKYMFPKAHAVAYVMMCFRIAYFKVHHPKAFYAMYFSLHSDALDYTLLKGGPRIWARKCEEIASKGSEASAKEKETQMLLEVAQEMAARGVQFLPVDIYVSHPWKCIIEPNGIRLPLVAIPGLGTAAASTIASARGEKPFGSIEEFKARTKLSKSLIELLRAEGCLAGVPETSQMSLWRS
ncbi:MAG: PolC-type DNA polymerase III [Bacillota bacterium]